MREKQLLLHDGSVSSMLMMEPAVKNLIEVFVYLNSNSYYSNKSTCQTGGMFEMNVIGFVMGVTTIVVHIRAALTLHDLTPTGFY